MQESEIRSDEMIAETLRLHKKDVENILLKKESFVHVSCPACSSKDKVFFCRKDGFTLEQCTKCETVYVSPRPTKEMLFTYYSTSLKISFWVKEVYPKTKEARVNHLVLPRVKKILEECDKHKIPMNSIMDVGAGFVSFCKQIEQTKRFKKIIAVDPSFDKNVCVEGVEVVSDFIENLSKRKVNVISSFEVIEHLFNPVEYFNAIFQMLSNVGLLYFTTPNIKGFDISVLKDKSNSIMPPGHLNYFHPKSIVILLEKCGFEVLDIQTPGKLDVELVKKKVLAGEVSLDTDLFLKRILMDGCPAYANSFQQWLIDNKLSSSMTVVAKKRIKL